MADKISGYGRNGADVAPTRSRVSTRSERANDADKEAGKVEGGSRSDSTTSDTQVRLTDTATNLKQIETRMADVPDVDRKRVETLRQRIESGAYQVNNGRLADRLLAFERDLA